jgi:hypothetical protein
MPLLPLSQIHKARSTYCRLSGRPGWRTFHTLIPETVRLLSLGICIFYAIFHPDGGDGSIRTGPVMFRPGEARGISLAGIAGLEDL